MDGVTVAERIGIPVEKVFKTLVTQGSDRNYYVFDVPVAKELDLKKAAKAVGVKNVEMIHVADINEDHRLCARRLLAGRHEEAVPHGLRRERAENCEHSILVSARGRIGWQIEAKPEALAEESRGLCSRIL